MFSLNNTIIEKLLQDTFPSYQATSLEDSNLGFGFLFYAFARLIRPENIVVIGSKAGFSVASFALGVKDNCGTLIRDVDCYDTKIIHNGKFGTVFFVDPSFSEPKGDPNHWHGIGFWDNPELVQNHWRKFGVSEYIQHYKVTSKEFLHHPNCPQNIDLLYIDGDHSRDGILHDFQEYHAILKPNAIILAHDVDPALKGIYPETGGYEAISALDNQKFEVCRLPIFPGLAIARKK